MKKALIIPWILCSILGSVTLASVPGVDYISDLLDQILVQQTQDEFSSEVLNTIKNIFNECSEKNVNEEMKVFCKSFLDEKIPQLETKWEKWNISWVEITNLWKLSLSERLELIWVPSTLKSELLSVHNAEDLNYVVLNFKDFWYSFLIPQINQEKVIDEYKFSCWKQRRNIDKNIKELKSREGASADQIEELEFLKKETECYWDIRIRKSTMENTFKWIHQYIWNTNIYYEVLSSLDSIWNSINLHINWYSLKEWENFSDVVKSYYDEATESRRIRKFVPFELFYSEDWSVYYTWEVEALSWRTHNIKTWYSWDLSSLQSKHIWVWKNLEHKINRWEVEIYFKGSWMFIYDKKNPSKYYEINLWGVEYVFWNYIAIDSNDENWKSSFIVG